MQLRRWRATGGEGRGSVPDQPPKKVGLLRLLGRLTGREAVVEDGVITGYLVNC